MNESTQAISLEALLPQVEKPARYIGGEWNSVVKDGDAVRLCICLAFPDLYELGLGNLGLQILYSILNDMEGVWAQRAYLPGPDMAAHMRESKFPLFMLESGAPVRDADAVGFTLQSELTYVNVLNMLELAGMPLAAQDRDDSMPLIFAGGPGACNPEPLVPFMDFFVIGDGEEVVVEISQCLLRRKSASRREKLEALNDIEGIYVPALHPAEGPAERSIRARFVTSLDSAPFPVRIIAPYVQLVHGGVGIEVLRGCTHGCRFCQAGMITRPVRERSINTILETLESTLRATGMEKATLLSLSTCDYSRIHMLLRRVAEQAHQKHVAIALPSLRLDRFAVELADYIAPVRRSGLTFAPEAGTQRMRAVINKNVSDEQLIDLAEEAFRRGWRHIKTYFMVGLPTEKDEDVEGIAVLCVRVLEAGRRIRRDVMVRTGISTFVPKPFTPFQWAPQIGLEETRNKQQHLAGLLRPHSGIKFGRHAAETSFIEGLLSRAGRDAAALLLSVLHHGGGYETWDEHLNFKAWQAAIDETGYDVEKELAERPTDMPLPWSYIDAQVSVESLREEWHRAQAGLFTADCREDGCRECGAQRRAGDSCRQMRQAAAAGRKEAGMAVEPAPPMDAHKGVQRLRFRVGKLGMVRFLSHLETVQTWIRILRRAGAPLAYSQGFHAHPKINFAAALPVGEESVDEVMDVVLHERCAPDEWLLRIMACLPEGFKVYEACEVDMHATALMAAQYGLEYDLHCPMTQEQATARLDALLEKQQWMVERSVKQRGNRKTIQMDIRPLTPRLDLTVHDDNNACFHFSTRRRNDKLAKPKDIIGLLALDPTQTRVRKTATLLR